MIKVSKIEKKLNIGLQTIANILHKKGYEIEVNNPNLRISDEMEHAIYEEYGLNKKEDSESIQMQEDTTCNLPVSSANKNENRLERKINKKQMNQNNGNQSNSLNRDEEKTKAQFATYLNMALNNLTILINFIVSKYIPSKDIEDEIEKKENEKKKKKKDNGNEENELEKINTKNKIQKDTMISYLKGEKNDTLLQQKIIDALNENLPFFKELVNDYIYRKEKKSIDKETAKYYGETFEYLYNTLNANRNKSTHGKLFKASSNVCGSDLIQPLVNTFDAARRIIKARFSYSDKDMGFLTGRLRWKEEWNGKRKKHIESDDFFYSFKCKDIDNKLRLSDTGIAFLACLFLEKKYINLFLCNTLLTQANVKNKTERDIIFEIFSCYRMHQKFEKLDSTKQDYALGLDMINELRKCPKPLFEALPAEKQKEFRIDISDNSSSDSTINDDVLFIRNTDRFPALAMQYIDKLNIFKKARFQVALGNYRFKFYDKQCIDGTTRMRSLQKELNGFGRIQEIEEKRKEIYDKWIKQPKEFQSDSADSQPYITDTHAHYVFNGNRVALALGAYGDNEQTGDYIPQPSADDKASCKVPDCWLSTYELPAVIFLQHLGGDPEKVIKKHVRYMRELYKAIQKGDLERADERKISEQYHLQYQFLPIKIRQLLSGEIKNEKKFNDHAEQLLEEMKEETKRRKEWIDAASKQSGRKIKRGKKGYVDIRSGKLAQFLADDIIALQPFDKESQNTNKGKLTGLNFQTMQATLALYNGNVDELRRLLDNAHLLNGQYAHPFLKNVVARRPKDTICLYKFYLEEKDKFLKKCIQDKNYKWQFLRGDTQKWAKRDGQYYKNLAKRYQEQPVELPRGLFEDAIKAKLSELHIEAIDNAKKMPVCNISYLIATYFKSTRRDDNSQPFYDYERVYRVFNLLNNKKDRNKLIDKPLNLDERKHWADGFENKLREYLRTNQRTIKNKEEVESKFKRLLHNYSETEKQIRQYKVEDMLLFLMAMAIFTKTKENQTAKSQDEQSVENVFKTIKLKECTPKGTVLAKEIPYQVTVKIPKTESKESKEIVVRKEKMKLTNYGKFLAFLYDKRVRTLFSGLKDLHIDYDKLARELERYDTQRPEAFLNSHRFEDAETEGLTPEDAKLKYKSVSPLFSMIVEKSKADPRDSESMQEIRNAFSHDFYPDLEKYVGKDELPEIAKQMGFIFKELIDKNIKK